MSLLRRILSIPLYNHTFKDHTNLAICTSAAFLVPFKLCLSQLLKLWSLRLPCLLPLSAYFPHVLLFFSDMRLPLQVPSPHTALRNLEILLEDHQQRFLPGGLSSEETVQEGVAARRQQRLVARLLLYMWSSQSAAVHRDCVISMSSNLFTSVTSSHTSKLAWGR